MATGLRASTGCRVIRRFSAAQGFGDLQKASPGQSEGVARVSIRVSSVVDEDAVRRPPVSRSPLALAFEEHARHFGRLLDQGESAECGGQGNGCVVGEFRVAECGEEQQESGVGVADARCR